MAGRIGTPATPLPWILAYGGSSYPTAAISLLTFSLASLPANATINSVTFTETCSGPGEGDSGTYTVTANIYQLSPADTAGFKEGSGTSTKDSGSSQPNMLCWNWRQFNSYRWAGNAGAGQPSAAARY